MQLTYFPETAKKEKKIEKSEKAGKYAKDGYLDPKSKTKIPDSILYT